VSVNVHDLAPSCAGALFGKSIYFFFSFFFVMLFSYNNKTQCNVLGVILNMSLFLTGVMNTCSAFSGGLYLFICNKTNYI